MPTTRPRYVITETDDVARALDDAALKWPEDAGDRPALVRRLLAEGHRSVVADRAAETLTRQEAVKASAGLFTGLYEPGYLEKLREDWPA